MFGSAGQPVTGARNEKTARVFLRMVEDERAERRSKMARARRRRQRLVRRLRSWFTRHR